MPGPKGVAVARPLSACSVREVAAAIAKARRPVSKPLSPEASERMARFKAALAGVVPAGQPFPVLVEEKKGVASWGLAKMPRELFDKVIPALARATPAGPGSPWPRWGWAARPRRGPARRVGGLLGSRRPGVGRPGRHAVPQDPARSLDVVLRDQHLHAAQGQGPRSRSSASRRRAGAWSRWSNPSLARSAR